MAVVAQDWPSPPGKRLESITGARSLRGLEIGTRESRGRLGWAGGDVLVGFYLSRVGARSVGCGSSEGECWRCLGVGVAMATGRGGW